MSLKARGSFHKTIVYSGCRSTHVVKRQNRKHNPNTIPQRGHRTMLRCLADVWGRLIPPATASWVNNLPDGEFSAYHWFMKFNLARWRIGKGPCTWFGNQDTGATPTFPSWAITQHFNYVRVLWPTSGFTNVYTATWHRGPGVGFTPTPATAIDSNFWVIYRETIVGDQPLTSGLIYYRLVLYSSNGIEFVQPDTKAALIT